MFGNMEANGGLSVRAGAARYQRLRREENGKGVAINGQTSKGKFPSVHLFTTLTYCFAEGNMAFAFSNHLPFAGGGRQSQFQLGFRNKGVSLLNLSIW